jgi:hypothetical protein
LYSYRQAQNIGIVKTYGVELINIRTGMCGSE